MGDVEEHDDMQFESVDSGASLSYPQQCSALRKNGFVLIKDRPCKIVDMSTSKTGKHGGAKVHLVGIDIFTQKKYEDLASSTDKMEVPHVSRAEFALVDINDGYLNLMKPSGEIKDDVRIPEGELGEQLQTEFSSGRELVCTILKSMGEEMCMSFKDAPKS